MSDTQYPILSEHPFLSHLTYGGNDYVGIVQNKDNNITSLYDYHMIKADQEKIIFLELAEQWWWESNRMIPINIFLKSDWRRFKPILRSFNSKDVIIEFGPCVSLSEISTKRIKRKSITLVKKVD
tara:strand:- start:56 stop:430 length:375 start_codon:yes stop_codon:yes gene_type:complete